MVKTLRPIGNSTGILLDKATLELAGLKEGDEVNVTVSCGSIRLTPARRVSSDEAFDAAARLVMGNRSELLRRLA